MPRNTQKRNKNFFEKKRKKKKGMSVKQMPTRVVVTRSRKGGVGNERLQQSTTD